MRLMPRKGHRRQDRRRRTIRHHGSIASIYKKKYSPCRQDDNSQGGEGLRLGLNLPEDIIRQIHGLMPLRDAARAACAAHIFLQSWRCHPNLTLSKESLGLKGTGIGKDEMTRDLICKVDNILRNYSGVGMKKLELELICCKKVDYCYLSNWLHIAVTAGIEELSMSLPYNGSIASIYKKKYSPCRQDDNSQGGEGLRLGLNLPEDIIRQIHGLMPLRDAARAACAAHIFLQSWRCHPNLTLSKESLGLKGTGIGKDEMTRDLICKVDNILRNYSGVGMKKLELELICCKKVDYCYLSNWLHIAVTAGIEELSMSLPYSRVAYNFPCSLLPSGSENSIKYLQLSGCAFRPTAGLDCWRRLTKLSLIDVLITGDELETILSNSFTLEWLVLFRCSEIVCVKIPCQLQRLSFLRVGQCRKLQEIESNAPNISTFRFFGHLVKISFGGALQLKDIQMNCSCQSNVFCYVQTKLMPSVPNVEKLSICLYNEMINTPTQPGKFLHLKYLHISLTGVGAISPAYDYLSLVSFLVAFPCLETFIFKVRQPDMKHDSIIGDTSHLRQLPEHRHDNLKTVMIAGFCSSKSFVELACHIVENASSLACLTLDTTHGCYSSDEVNKRGTCVPMGRDSLKEAQRALLAIRTHIEGRIPSGVKLNVSEPCSRCHAVEH